MSISLSTAKEMLSLYIKAEKEVLLNQSYKINDRTFTRANLQELSTQRAMWETKVNQLSSNRRGPAVRRVILND